MAPAAATCTADLRTEPITTICVYCVTLMLLALTIWVEPFPEGRAACARSENNAVFRAAIGLAAMVAIAVGGSLAATQASAASIKPQGGDGGLNITKQYFGSTVEPYTGRTPTYRYTLTNARGMTVKILTFGGIVQAIDVPGPPARRPTSSSASRPCRTT